ncbi:MAG: DUF6206 family protein [Candidatus Marinimicrobia bacterium]|jgi:hypothetical protein|nr:DUF6206 family protein [Candidatus Neomarinimicrobiota bacterium]MDP6836447.1 DUF6206 family protein [Candidatus Neomarinimicrobiota bacterium]MDP6967343.1 DUF6206 family protein [Candidatus Neomarinimicrobiota bacterium]|tara:strand:- start:58 stop:978 length:921 start_codon:yes stop_codon:yes gene_type:complete
MIDPRVLEEFELGLDSTRLEISSVSATVLGYGEISTVFKLSGNSEVACKRMPLFPDSRAAENYQRNYEDYCRHLEGAGVELPQSSTQTVEIQGRPVVLYILQKSLPPERFCHKLIHTLDQEEISGMIRKVVSGVAKVWAFNRQKGPLLEIALDGQLSNWVLDGDIESGRLWYVDTSTPLYRINGEEQLDPELFLESAPSFLRWIIRWLFLEDVMNRYYDQRQVMIDLAANLYKEQRPDLVPTAVSIINDSCSGLSEPLTEEDVEKYYKEDKLIWILFLAFRRIDRWITTKILRKRYEFVLPGRIKR